MSRKDAKVYKATGLNKKLCPLLPLLLCVKETSIPLLLFKIIGFILLL